MSNLSNQAPARRHNGWSGLPPDVQGRLDDLERQYALEREAVLVGWQGPSPARVRLINEVEARYRKHKASVMRRLEDPFGRP
jgi:hypothetical protein